MTRLPVPAISCQARRQKRGSGAWKMHVLADAADDKHVLDSWAGWKIGN